MNILPLVLVLLLMLSVLTIEKLEKFQSLAAVQKQYQVYLAESERQAFNERQKRLYKEHIPSQRQLSFTSFFEKKERESKPEQFKQIRLIVADLIRNLYSEAAFFKNLEAKRPNFIDELLDDFIASADRLSEKDKIRRIEDIRRIRLSDPELQLVFYHMLKGTITKEKLNRLKENRILPPQDLLKSYVSLLTFLKHDSRPTISIQHSSRELLMAIFGKAEIAEAIMTKRNELNTPDASAQFANEFKGKQRAGISDDLLDFSISLTDKTPYN